MNSKRTTKMTGTLATLALVGAALVPMASATAAEDPFAQPGIITISEESKAILESVGLETSYEYGALKVTATPGQEESTLVYGTGIYTEDALPVLAADSTLSRSGGLGYVSTLEDTPENGRYMYPSATTGWKQGGSGAHPAGITWLSDNLAGGLTPEIREKTGLRDFAGEGFTVSDCTAGVSVCGFYVQTAQRLTWFEDGTLEPAALDDAQWQALRTTGEAIFIPVEQDTRAFLRLTDIPDDASWTYNTAGRATAKWAVYEDDGYIEYETFNVFGTSDTGTDAHLAATPWVESTVIPEEIMVRPGAGEPHRIGVESWGTPQHVGSINVFASAGWDSEVPEYPPLVPVEPPVVIPQTPVETPVVFPEVPVDEPPVITEEIVTPEEPVVPEQVTPQIPERIESGNYGSSNLLWMGTLLAGALTLIGARFARYTPSHKA